MNTVLDCEICKEFQMTSVRLCRCGDWVQRGLGDLLAWGFIANKDQRWHSRLGLLIPHALLILSWLLWKRPGAANSVWRAHYRRAWSICKRDFHPSLPAGHCALPFLLKLVCDARRQRHVTTGVEIGGGGKEVMQGGKVKMCPSSTFGTMGPSETETPRRGIWWHVSCVPKPLVLHSCSPQLPGPSDLIGSCSLGWCLLYLATHQGHTGTLSLGINCMKCFRLAGASHLFFGISGPYREKKSCLGLHTKYTNANENWWAKKKGFK